MPRSELSCTPRMRTLSKISPLVKTSPRARVPFNWRISRSTKVRLLLNLLRMPVPPLRYESFRRRQPSTLKPLRRLMLR
ncbi:hypothetical protein D9M68_677180 [compost metagenome]